MNAGKRHALGWFKTHSFKLTLAAAVLILLSLLLGASLKTIILAALLIILASFSTFYFNYAAVPVNFELVKLSTIIMAYTHGIAAGIAVGVLSTLFGKVLIGRIDGKLPLSMAAILFVAI